MENTKLLATQLEAILNETIVDKFQQTMNDAQRLMAYYRCAILEVETKFKVLNEQFSLRSEQNPIDSIRTRLKSPESIGKKLAARGLPLTLKSVEENLNDVAGLRIICPFVEDIYLLADCLVQQDDIVLIAQKDYIKNPKPNGYRSLHLIVEIPIFLQNEKRNMKVEVQFRTIAMDSWANLEHRLRYKKELSDTAIAQTTTALNECAAMSAALDTKMQEIRDIIGK